MERTPEEVIEHLRSYITERFFDEGLTELLQEAADTIERLNTMLIEEARKSEEAEERANGIKRAPVEPIFIPSTIHPNCRCVGPKATTKTDHHRMICDQLTAVYTAKNHDYGDSFARVRGMHPEAICIRLWDKLLRLESLMGGKKAQVDESIEDTLKDLANYAIMELMERHLDQDREERDDE